MISTKRSIFCILVFTAGTFLLLTEKAVGFSPKQAALAITRNVDQKSDRFKRNHITAQNAWPKNRDPKGVAPDYPRTKSRLAVTVLATILTWQAHNAGLCGPVLASSAATLSFSLWSPGLGQAAFAGSFAGMSSLGVLTGWKEVALTGSLTAGLFEILIHRKNKFLGLGGRLGFLAFIAVNAVALTSGVQIFPSEFISFFNWSAFVEGIRSAPLVSGAFYAALGSVATIVLRETAEGEKSDMADPVRASAVVGIISALLVGIDKQYSSFGALMAFGGSFTGMSLPSRLIKGRFDILFYSIFVLL